MGRAATVRHLRDYRDFCVWRERNAADHSDPNDVYPAHGYRVSTPGCRTECEGVLQTINAGEKGGTQAKESQNGPYPNPTHRGEAAAPERKRAGSRSCG